MTLFWKIWLLLVTFGSGLYLGSWGELYAIKRAIKKEINEKDNSIR